MLIKKVKVGISHHEMEKFTVGHNIKRLVLSMTILIK